MNPGDIFWIEFPANTGHEQAGRRPAIILQDDTFAGILPLVMVVPLTGAMAASRFPGTIIIEPDANNNLRKTSVALVFQIRAVDRRVVQGRIGNITSNQKNDLYTLLDKLTGRLEMNSETEV